MLSPIRAITISASSGVGLDGVRTNAAAIRFVGSTKTLQISALGLHQPRNRQCANAPRRPMRPQLAQHSLDCELMETTTNMPVTVVVEKQSRGPGLWQT